MRFLVPFVALLLAAPAVAQTPGFDRVKQEVARGETESAQIVYQRLSGELGVIRQESSRTRSTYRSQLNEIDRLKRQRSSWRRDRQLREAYARSQATAKHLAELDGKKRNLEARRDRVRARLLEAIASEQSITSSDRRRRELAELRAGLDGTSRTKRRKILLPDDRIDPLASSDELEEQAELLAQSEAELAREIANLELREKRFDRMAKLQKTRARAQELSALDDNAPRRTTARVGATSRSSDDSAGGAGTNADPAPQGDAEGAEAPPADPGTGTGDGDFSGSPGGSNGGTGSDFSIIFADVVDTSTLNAYRSAEGSRDPNRRAAATRRMREQAQKKLRQLRARRKQMIERAGDMRR